MSNAEPATGQRYTGVTTALDRGDIEAAARHCKALIEEQPADALAWYLHGGVVGRQGDHARSIELLLKSAELARRDHSLLRRIVDALLDLRAFSALMPIFEKVELSDPYLMLALARTRWGLGEYHQAVAMMRELWKISPGQPLLAIHYSRALTALAQPGQAADVLDSAIRQAPQLNRLVAARARLELSLSGLQAARVWIEAHGGGQMDGELGLLARALADISSGHQSDPVPDSGSSSVSEGFAQMMALRPDHWTGDNVALLRHCLDVAPKEGLIVECGVFHGRTINLLASWAPSRSIHGFDSFQGLPGSWGNEPGGSYSTRGQLPSVPDTVSLHAGWFEQALPEFRRDLNQPIALVHVDCDLYESTVCVLEALGPALAPDAVIVFDEMFGYAGWQNTEYRSWNEYRSRDAADWETIGAVVLGQAAAFRRKAPEMFQSRQ